MNQSVSRDALIQDALDVYKVLEDSHKKNLAHHGVKIPDFWSNEEQRTVNFRALQLIYLYKHLGELVSKEDVAKYVRSIEHDAAGDQQVRHLKYAGWDIRLSGKAVDQFEGKKVPNGMHVLVGVQSPHVDFKNERVKRLGRAEAPDWEALKASYGFRCACCGVQPTPVKGGDPHGLEKGHKDPNGSQALSNLIPMCAKCNNHASNNLVFDDDGRVKALANEKVVLKSSEAVQYQIYLELHKKYGSSTKRKKSGSA